jgi:DNA invertase Pin-like site-specific DNA recombinase
VDVVVVWKFDRFARSLNALISGLELCRSLGIDFVSVTEAVDTSLPAGELVFQMIGAVAQFERSQIAERVKSGREAKRASPQAESPMVFGQPPNRRKMFRAGRYARVSTHDQQTLPMQNRALRQYAARRGWTVVMQVREVGSGAAQREARKQLLDAARRREIDTVLVWRLDRWGRSVTDLLSTLQELEHLGVGFASLTEALDLTTPADRAMAGLLAVFAEFEREILRERVRAGLAHARQNGKRLGRPATAALHTDRVRKLHRSGLSKSAIARRLHIGRTSVRRILQERI